MGYLYECLVAFGMGQLIGLAIVAGIIFTSVASCQILLF